MNRRSFLGRAALAPLAIVGLPVSDGYEPCGHLAVGELGAVEVDYITLDGQRMTHVSELDDIQGWLKHYADFESYTRSIYRTGVVRVYWKAS